MTLIDLWRTFNFLVCVISFVILLVRYKQHRNDWNAKTLNYWYGRTMWTIAGGSLSLEGYLRHSPFRYSTVLITAAAVVTLIALMTKGAWGSDK